MSFGLPSNFNFDVIRTKSDVQRLLGTLPNRDRGVAARRLYERRDHIGPALAYFALMRAWEYDDGVLVEAFETLDAFAAALCPVAPPIKRKRPLRVWRCIAVRDAHPGHAAIGLSWTRSRDIACWFATTYRNRAKRPGARPFVFTVQLLPSDILAFHDGRKEQEALVDLAALEGADIMVDGTTILTHDLTADGTPPAVALADWRAVGERYEARKRQDRLNLLKAAKKGLGRS